MRGKIALYALLAIVSTPLGWRVTFDANADNIAIRVVTWCVYGKPYQRVDWQSLEDSGQTELLFRREDHKGSTDCTIYVDVMRAEWDAAKSAYMDPNHDYIGESISVREGEIASEK